MNYFTKLISKGNLNKNIITELKLFFSSIWFQVIFTPLMLLSIGAEKYGLWVFLFSIPNLLMMMNISVSAPSRNEMSILFNQGKNNKLQLIFHNAILIQIITVIIIIFIFILAVLITENRTIIDNFWILFFLFFASIVKLLFGPIYTILTYRGSYKKYNNINFYFNIFNPVIMPIAAYLTSELLYTSIIFFLSACLQFIFLYLSIDDNLISLAIKKQNISLNQIKNIYKKSLGFNLEIVSNLIKHSGIIFVLGINNNLVMSATLASAKTMFYFFPIKAIDIIYKPLYLEITRFYKQDGFEKSFKKYFLKIFIFVIFFISAYLIFSKIYGIYLYDFWVSNKINLSNDLLFLIVLDSIFFITGYYFALPSKSVNQYKMISFIELIINSLVILIVFNEIGSSDFNIISLYNIVLAGSFITMIVKFLSFAYFIIKK